MRTTDMPAYGLRRVLAKHPRVCGWLAVWAVAEVVVKAIGK